MDPNRPNIIEVVIKYRMGQVLDEEEKEVLAIWREAVPEIGQLIAPMPKDAITIDKRLVRRFITACIFCFLAFCWFLVAVDIRYLDSQPPVLVKTRTILPDEDHVFLTRSDGKVINLKELPIGTLICEENGHSLRLVDANILAYDWDPPGETMGEDSILHRPSEELALVRLTIGQKCPPFLLQMKDGTCVGLAPGSDFRWALERSARQPYWLAGKAFFNVVRDPENPFIIQLPNGATIKVLGTSFCVDAYPGKPDIKVAVFSGAVQVSNRQDSIVLRAHTEAIVDGEHLKPRKMTDSAATMNWLKDVLLLKFYNAEFSVVIAKVAARYGCTIHNPENLQGIPVNADFPVTATLSSVLKFLEIAQNGEVFLRLRNKTIEISKPF